MNVYIYVCIMCVYVCMYRLCVTTKITINTIGKVFRNRTEYLALPVPLPAGSGYREFDPQSPILKANSLATHNHPQVLGLQKTFHTVQCWSNKPPSKRNKSTARGQYKCRPTSFATFLITFLNDVRTINLFLVVANLNSQLKSRFSITESLISNKPENKQASNTSSQPSLCLKQPTFTQFQYHNILILSLSNLCTLEF